MTGSLPLPSERAVVVAAQRHVSSELGGEAVVLDMDRGVYFGLNSVAARVWELVQTPQAVSVLIDHVVAEFDVERARCALDVRELLRKLAEQRLVSVTETA